jgi:hypothetical protein
LTFGSSTKVAVIHAIGIDASETMISASLAFDSSRDMKNFSGGTARCDEHRCLREQNRTLATRRTATKMEHVWEEWGGIVLSSCGT